MARSAKYNKPFNGSPWRMMVSDGSYPNTLEVDLGVLIYAGYIKSQLKEANIYFADRDIYVIELDKKVVDLIDLYYKHVNADGTAYAQLELGDFLKKTKKK